jgi:hypothetical protein
VRAWHQDKPRHSLPPASSTTQIAVIFCETSNPTKRVIKGLRRCESPGDATRIAALSADQAPTAIIGCPPIKATSSRQAVSVGAHDHTTP